MFYYMVSTTSTKISHSDWLYVRRDPALTPLVNMETLINALEFNLQNQKCHTDNQQFNN